MIDVLWGPLLVVRRRRLGSLSSSGSSGSRDRSGRSGRRGGGRERGRRMGLARNWAAGNYCLF